MKISINKYDASVVTNAAYVSKKNSLFYKK